MVGSSLGVVNSIRSSLRSTMEMAVEVKLVGVEGRNGLTEGRSGSVWLRADRASV